jgi:hypothetical protein
MTTRPVNLVRDINRFLAAWDDPTADFNRREVRIFATTCGNLNDTGDPGPDRGVLLTRWHPAFSDAIEPGVRELVLLLVEGFGLVTYTSCQGHDYTEIGLPSVERNVGIFPRSDEERTRVWHLLSQAAAEVNAGEPEIRVRVAADLLRSKVPGDKPAYPVVDLYFDRPAGMSWQDYLTGVDIPYQGAVRAFRNAADSFPGPS